MKAVVRRAGQLVDTDIAEVTPGEGQVLVKTLVCGICGSEGSKFNSFPKPINRRLVSSWPGSTRPSTP